MSMGQTDELPVLDLMAAGFQEDPHGTLRSLRDQSELVRILPVGGVGALSAAACHQVLRDARFGAAGTRTLEIAGVAQGPIWDWWRLILFQTNPPIHTRLRALLARAFTPRRADAVRGRVREIADQLVGEIDGDVVDVDAHLAHQIPVRIISEMLGAPMDDHDQIGRWANDLGLAFAFLIPPDRITRIEAALEGLYGYVDDLIAKRRTEPGDDLVSALVGAEAEGDRLSDEELRAMVVNLVFAGHDTTKGLISIALKLLAEHPEQMALLSKNPALAEGAVEEALRFEPVVPALPRVAREPAEIAGVPIEQDEFVSVNILSANRDPALYERPDAFDITRGARDHLSFGRGAHFCLGAALARAEAQEAISAVARRASRLELVGEEPRFVPFAAVRRYESLAVRLIS
jgi:cytochrome P450